MGKSRAGDAVDLWRISQAHEQVRALVDENAAALRNCEERMADLLDDSDQAVPVPDQPLH